MVPNYWDKAILKGLVRMARLDGPPGIRSGSISGNQLQISQMSAPGAKALLAETVITAFVASGGGLASPFPAPYRENEVVRMPTWRRWKPADLSFSFGPASLRIAASASGAPALPDSSEPWLSGDSLAAWRCLSLASEPEVARWANAGCPEGAWFVLGFPAQSLSKAHRLDPEKLFRPPLLPLIESLMPWSEWRWRKALTQWNSAGTAGRSAILAAWEVWSGICAKAGRPDLTRGMIRGAEAACGKTDWMNALRDRLPAPGAMPFSELSAWETDFLAVEEMLSGMAAFRDRAEELVYIDETYASAMAFKEAVPAMTRDRLQVAALEIRNMRALNRGDSR